ncbi:GntR family transcriptional regulator [Verrucomicrobium sp. BvORR034]|uniref:LacI family DNA-binding transcriptional regulator n=1 Tax=Verrucomicrobium sp. BvORR034 TaxID=1396418 RepID=UPI000679E8C2|nr:GntR family transcriptional regulator [Verrucomicrobium sp. BvORR034]
MKHQEISRQLATEIAAGKHAGNDRLPSEAQLVKRFNVSRPTVGRALRDLQEQGLIYRRAGSGTYVRESVTSAGSAGARTSFRQLGFILTSHGKPEIFESIFGELSGLARVHDYGMWWGGTSRPKTEMDTRVEEVEALCEQFIEKGVAGVFFVPFEHRPYNQAANHRIIERLRGAGIPVVLVDRDIGAFPERSPMDLVGLDNFAGGYILAEHLIKLGAKHLGYVVMPFSAPPADARIAGARAAMMAHNLEVPRDFVQTGDPGDVKFVRQIVAGSRVDALMCTTDFVAARLLQSLSHLKISVPQDLRVVGFDDVQVASLLSVPLTTMHQPCRDIAHMAFNTLLERMTSPTLPPRMVLLSPHLVVRESCGAYTNRSR